MKRILCLAFVLAFVLNTAYSLDTVLIEREILRAVNKERIQNSLLPLQLEDRLTAVAREHSREMQVNETLSHISKEKTPAERIQEACPDLLFGAFENIAYHKGDSETEIASAVVAAWMGSEGHRKNILNINTNHTGIGVSFPKEDGIYYITQIMTDSIARLLIDSLEGREVSSLEFSRETEVKLKFEFLGSFPKENLVVFVRFPDEQAKFLLSEGKSYYTGCGVFTPQWEGKRSFTVTVPARYGIGEYKVYMGKEKQFYPFAISFYVR